MEEIQRFLQPEELEKQRRLDKADLQMKEAYSPSAIYGGGRNRHERRVADAMERRVKALAP